MNTVEVLSSIKASGKKITKVRRETVDIVFGSPKPLTAPQILNLLEERGIKVNKTTLYRELSFLVEQKIFSVVRLNSYVTHYEPTHLAHRHHLVCDVCGKVEEVLCKELEKSMSGLEKEVAKDGFKIRDHHLEFYGLCSNCK